MIHVLVTGASGQLGSCIKDLKNQYDDIYFIYTDYLELNICDLDQVQTFFKAHNQIQYCINCAAYTAVDNAETDVDKVFEINTKGAKNLATACNEYGTVLIHISTDFVFDGEKTEPYLEIDVANPISVYGDSKLQGEIEIREILKQYFILRTSWLYSEHGNNFMKTMIRLAETRDEISVVSDQIGTPTYARDLAKAILYIISIKAYDYGTYHYSNLGEISWFDFSKAIFEMRKSNINVIPIKTKDYPTLARRPKFSVLDKTKIKNTLQIEIPHWRDSLMEAISNYNER